MKVTFDVEEMLNEIRGEERGKLIAIIDEPEVLDYLAKVHAEDEEIVQRIRLNKYAWQSTIEFIASNALEGKYKKWSLWDIYYDRRLSDKTKKKLREAAQK